MLDLKKINIAYGVIQVVHDVELQVREGECVALLGANGAGKTTLLNAISGTIPHQSGEILFRNQPCILNNPAIHYEWGIVQVPEGGKIFPHMTIQENLLMGAVGRNEAWEKRWETLKWVYKIFSKLSDRRNQQSKLLSGGERQLMVVGRGLMGIPKLLMIDEPSLGLSPKVLLEIYSTLKTLRDEGLTILISEQNVTQALKIASRGYVLENGRVVMQGSSGELLSNEYVKKAYLGL